MNMTKISGIVTTFPSSFRPLYNGITSINKRNQQHEKITASVVVYVRGELRSLDSLTFDDLKHMSDDEYAIYANKIALITGIC